VNSNNCCSSIAKGLRKGHGVKLRKIPQQPVEDCDQRPPALRRGYDEAPVDYITGASLYTLDDVGLARRLPGYCYLAHPGSYW
jgi:hypothetical protein